LKIHLISDLHTEFNPYTVTPPPGGCDVVVLAGDVGGTQRIGRIETVLRAAARIAPTVYIAGNHEFYGSSVEASDVRLQNLSEYVTKDLAIKEKGTHPVHYLSQGKTVEIAGALFWGATLWSDFCLYGTPEFSMKVAESAAVGVNDFRAITVDGKLVTAKWMLQQHLSERNTLEKADGLARSKGLPLVVVSHFMPSPGSVHPKYRGNGLTPYFASNLDDLMAGPRRLKSLKLVVHGHCHDACDHVVGDVRVVANPYGYRSEQGKNGFEKHLVIEI